MVTVVDSRRENMRWESAVSRPSRFVTRSLYSLSFAPVESACLKGQKLVKHRK